MRFPASTILAAVLLCGAVYLNAQAQTGPAKKNPDATVSGRITIKGKPAPGIVVGLRSSRLNRMGQPDATFKATTDQDGRYRITNISPGNYQVAPVAPVFVSSDSQASQQSLIISEGDNVTGMDFDLVKGGVVTGKVTDADGQPIAEERVFLVAADYPRSGPSRGSGHFSTDDRGIYRMFGIPPGRYKVSVGEESLSVISGFRPGRTLPITFYPSATESAKAAVVEVGEGTEANNIDITLARAPRTFSVSARVVDGETGKPIINVGISLMKTMIIDAHSSSGFGGDTNVRSNADGEFTLEKLPAGKYSVSIQPPSGSDLIPEPVAFDLSDQDVTGLVIKAFSGASLSGTVVLERTRDGNNVSAPPPWLSVYWSNEGRSSNSSTQIKPDGSFHVGGLTAGTVGFSVGAWSPTGDAKPIPILRLERDGVVQPNGIQVQNGEHISGIRVVAAYSSGSIRGVVKMDNGALPPGGQLFVSLVRTGDTSPNGGGHEIDARGHFLIEGLATGTYELTLTTFVPGWRQEPRATKQMVNVTDGAVTDVLMTIDLTQPKRP